MTPLSRKYYFLQNSDVKRGVKSHFLLNSDDGGFRHELPLIHQQMALSTKGVGTGINVENGIGDSILMDFLGISIRFFKLGALKLEERSLSDR